MMRRLWFWLRRKHRRACGGDLVLDLSHWGNPLPPYDPVLLRLFERTRYSAPVHEWNPVP